MREYSIGQLEKDAELVNETLLDDLLDRIRGWRLRHGLSIREAARMAGLDNSTLLAIDTPDWSPSGTTLRALLRVMDGPAGRLLDVAPRIDRLSLGVLPFIGEDGYRCLERVLKPAALRALGHDGLAAVCRARDARVCGEHAIGFARAAIAGAAVHLVDASAPVSGRFRFLAWDSSTGYRGGTDFTGTALAEVNDMAYRASLLAAYQAVRDSGRARVSFIDRRGPEERRTFYRALVPLVTAGGVPEILSVTLPQEAQTARYLFPNRLRV